MKEFLASVVKLRMRLQCEHRACLLVPRAFLHLLGFDHLHVKVVKILDLEVVLAQVDGQQFRYVRGRACIRGAQADLDCILKEEQMKK